MGWSAFPSAFLFGIIQTGLSEEILFRGFLAKRLISRFGFATGNLPQGLVFGLLHGAMFFLVTTLLKALKMCIRDRHENPHLGRRKEQHIVAVHRYDKAPHRPCHKGCLLYTSRCV